MVAMNFPFQGTDGLVIPVSYTHLDVYKRQDDMLYLGIMVEHPARSSRSVVVCAYEGQGVCQATRRLGDVYKRQDL